MRSEIFHAVILFVVVIFLPRVSGSDHRPCREDVCEYWFVFEETPSLTHKAEDTQVYNVGLNGTDLVLVPSLYHEEQDLPEQRVLTRDQASMVNTLDGYQMPIITINGQFLGPTIDVIEGAQVNQQTSYVEPMLRQRRR